MKKKVSPIGEIVKEVFAQLENQGRFTKEEIESRWEELVGRQGLSHSKPTSLKKGILTVRVDSSAWLQELTLKKRQLLKGLKRRMGKDRITEIHFRIGEF